MLKQREVIQRQAQQYLEQLKREKAEEAKRCEEERLRQEAERKEILRLKMEEERKHRFLELKEIKKEQQHCYMCQ